MSPPPVYATDPSPRCRFWGTPSVPRLVDPSSEPALTNRGVPVIDVVCFCFLLPAVITWC